MSVVVAEHVSKFYGEVAALDDVSITFPDGSFFALLGPSGSGKTTLLRAIAGFIDSDRGRISIGGREIMNVPPYRRHIGMVFQNYALFPHMTVFNNVAFGLSVRRVPSSRLRRKVEEFLALVRLEGMERRKPHQLSGGQQQRVALARALITEPRVLLLDEPLGALDKRLREEMQIELKHIQRKVGITTIFVTHDQEEALTLSDHIAIINEGRLVQSGSPSEVYERPRTVFAARFLGDANFFEGRAAETRAGVGRVSGTKYGDLLTAEPLPAKGLGVTLAVRPEKFFLIARGEAANGGEEPCNRLDGVIKQIVYSGSSVTYIVDVAGEEFRVFEQNRDARFHEAGAAVRILWSPRHSILVRP